MKSAPFVARVSIWKIAFAMVLFAGALVVGLKTAGLLNSPPKPGAMLMSWFLIIGSAAFLAMGFLRLTGDKVQLVISAEGVSWLFWSNVLIPWSEVSEISQVSIKRARYIVLALRDPSRFPPTKPLGKLAVLTRGMIGGDIALSVAGTDRSFSEALSAVEHFAGELMVERLTSP